MAVARRVNGVILCRAGLKRIQRVAIALVLGVATPLSFAGVLEVTAVFKPDPANPMVNKFVNTSPNLGHCLWQPAFCETWGLASLLSPLSFSANGPIAADNEMRQGAMFRVPSQFRSVQVTHVRTGEQQTLDMRIGGLGGWHELGGNVSQMTGTGGAAGHNLMWRGGWWARDALPCRQTSGTQTVTSTGSSYFWRIPEGDGTCVKQALFRVPNLRYTSLYLGYELRTPNPLSMSSGDYVGSLTYTVGPGMDFDMGDVMMPNDNVLTFNFTLSVEHDLKVEVPPGGNRIELVPQGGWQAWLNQGRKPARLFRDQTFNISASSRFKMQLECERVMGNTCALRNADGHQVPLDISVSLPYGLNRPDGSAVNRQPLLLSGAGTQLFQPGHYVNRRPGTLHFEVGREHTDNMLSQGGSTYSGMATVIWDSDL